MENYTTFVGMDVHTRSVTCEALNVKTGEKQSKVFRDCSSDIEIVSWVKSLQQPAYCAYESGVTGFHLAKKLIKHGIDCDVLAVSTLRTSDKEKKTKSDKVDANHILFEIVHFMPTYSTVYIPTDEQLAARELARVKTNAVEQLKRSKQALISFLQLYGYVYNERLASGRVKKRWTRNYYNWVRQIEFEQEMMQVAFMNHYDCVRQNEKLVQRINQQIKEFAQNEKIKPYVDAFLQLKGIDIHSAFLMYAELGNFDRFQSGRKVSCYAGLVPKNHSSGQSEVKGSITKAGNKYIRKVLVEGLAGLRNWNTNKKRLSIKIKVSPQVAQLAERANTRVISKYKRLTKQGKHSNIARVACASEMIRWIWVIGKQVESELKAN